MAKDQERKVARIMFVENGKSRKEIAEALNVREKTVGEWATKGAWEEQRTTHLTRSDNVVSSLKALINHYTERLNELERDEEADPKERSRVLDALSKTSKALENARQDTEITLGTRIRVMEWVFAELHKVDPTTHHKLIDFQERLLDEAARLHA